MQELEIKNLMTSMVKCVAPTERLSHIAKMMKEYRYSCMVITENNKPIGILTERDIVAEFTELHQKGNNYDPTAGTIMSYPPVTVAEHTLLCEALVIAKSKNIRHLPVTDAEGNLVGLVTQTDLVAAHFSIFEAQSALLERAVNNRTEELVALNNKLRELSLEDPLLKIGNRRSMEVDLNYTHAAATRYNYTMLWCYSTSIISNFIMIITVTSPATPH